MDGPRKLQVLLLSLHLPSHDTNVLPSAFCTYFTCYSISTIISLAQSRVHTLNTGELVKIGGDSEEKGTKMPPELATQSSVLRHKAPYKRAGCYIGKESGLCKDGGLCTVRYMIQT